ncbi:MAG: hypothetical protein U0174_26285 [Polyangiaceae bacterium]
MNFKKLLCTLSVLGPLAMGCAAAGPSDPSDTSDKQEASATDPNVGSVQQSLQAEEGQRPATRMCCSNIPGWGSVVYYEMWGGYSWVPYTFSYQQGVLCPGVSGTCVRVETL